MKVSWNGDQETEPLSYPIALLVIAGHLIAAAASLIATSLLIWLLYQFAAWMVS